MNRKKEKDKKPAKTKTIFIQLCHLIKKVNNSDMNVELNLFYCFVHKNYCVSMIYYKRAYTNIISAIVIIAADKGKHKLN